MVIRHFRFRCDRVLSTTSNGCCLSRRHCFPIRTSISGLSVPNIKACTSQCAPYLYAGITQGTRCSCSSDAGFCNSDGFFFPQSQAREQLVESLCPAGLASGLDHCTGEGGDEDGYCDTECASLSFSGLQEYCGGPQFFSAFGKVWSTTDPEG